MRTSSLDVKYAIAASIDGIEETLHVFDSLSDARLRIRTLRHMETHCTEGNGYTGRSYAIMRGTSSCGWKQVR